MEREAWKAIVHGIIKSWTWLSDFYSHSRWCSDEESTCTRDMDSIPRSGKSPEGGYGNPLQYSYLENPVDRGVWQATVYGIAKSWK